MRIKLQFTILTSLLVNKQGGCSSLINALDKVIVRGFSIRLESESSGESTFISHGRSNNDCITRCIYIFLYYAV